MHSPGDPRALYMYVDLWIGFSLSVLCFVGAFDAPVDPGEDGIAECGPCTELMSALQEAIPSCLHSENHGYTLQLVLNQSRNLEASNVHHRQRQYCVVESKAALSNCVVAPQCSLFASRDSGIIASCACSSRQIPSAAARLATLNQTPPCRYPPIHSQSGSPG